MWSLALVFSSLIMFLRLYLYFICFSCWIISHCMDRPHFVHQSMDIWWRLPFGYYDWCRCEHSRVSFCVDRCFHFPRAYTWEWSRWAIHSCWAFGGTGRLFSVATIPVSIPTSPDPGPGFFTSSPTLVTVCLFYSSHPDGHEAVSPCGFNLLFLDG